MTTIKISVSRDGGKTIIDMEWLGITELRNKEADLLLSLLEKSKKLRKLNEKVVAIRSASPNSPREEIP